MSFLTCSRPDPSSRMGSSAVAVSSSVCIFPSFPSFLSLEPGSSHPGTVRRQGPPRRTSSVTPSAASRYPVSRWRGLRQTASSIPDSAVPPPRPLSRGRAQCCASTRSILRLGGQSRMCLRAPKVKARRPPMHTDRFRFRRCLS